MFTSFRNILSRFQEEESSTESTAPAGVESKAVRSSSPKIPILKTAPIANPDESYPSETQLALVNAQAEPQVAVMGLQSDLYREPAQAQAERQLAIMGAQSDLYNEQDIKSISLESAKGPSPDIISFSYSLEKNRGVPAKTVMMNLDSGSSPIEMEEGRNLDIIKTTRLLFSLPREPKSYAFLDENNIVERIKSAFAANKKSVYSNVIGINDSIPLVYTNMLTFKDKRYTDLVKFYDLGLEYLKIRQSEFYDLFHMMYYNNLMNPNNIPYEREDVVYMSKLKQADLLHLINVVTNDKYRGDQSHASLLFFLLSCGIKAPINTNAQAYIPRMEKYSEWSPFQILTYILLFMDKGNTDYSKDLPYKTAYMLNIPSNGKFYDMIVGFPFDKQPTLDDLKRELYNLEIKVDDRYQDMVEFYFYEFIPALKMAIKK
jgi:hypothetical protein